MSPKMTIEAFAPYQHLAAELLKHLPSGQKDGSHDLSHIHRVWVNAQRIWQVEGGDIEVLFAATVLHDCVAVEKNSPLRGQAGAPDPGAGHCSGLEQAESEPKQGVGEKWSENRPEDWNPPPGNPGSDQDAQVERDNGTARTDEDKLQQRGSREGEVPLPADDQSPVDEEMRDVDANNSVSSEHPKPR